MSEHPTEPASTETGEALALPSQTAAHSSDGGATRFSSAPTLPGEPNFDPASVPETARFRIARELARGGMGVVFRGRDETIGREVAIKTLRDEFANDPTVLLRFMEEAQISGQLQHPGVVPIYEFGEFEDRRPFIAMKLVKGRTMAAHLAERSSPGDGLAKFMLILEQAAQTVAFAHDRGVIHRDLKPSNVMIGPFGEVQVMDWGLAKTLKRGPGEEDSNAAVARDSVIEIARPNDAPADLSRNGSVLGTPSYMAPEQARGEVTVVDERADVFALGSILCEILTGNPAFVGSSPGVILSKAQRGDLTDALRRLDATGFDEELVALAKRCLEPDPAHRPRTAAVVAESVAAHRLEVESRLRAAEVARAEAQARAIEERKRRRWQVGLAASSCALTVVSGFSIVYMNRQEHIERIRIERRLEEVRAGISAARVRADEAGGWERVLRETDAAADEVAGSRVAADRDWLADRRSEAAEGARFAARWAWLRDELAAVRAQEVEEGTAAADEGYARAFDDFGFTAGRLAGPVADRLARFPEPARVELAGHLDHWALIRRERKLDHATLEPIVALAKQLDSDALRCRLRSTLIEPDSPERTARLVAIASEPGSAESSSTTAVTLARLLELIQRYDLETDVLNRAWARRPGDAWIHLTLARMLDMRNPGRIDDAIGHYMAARALLPTTAHPLAHRLVEARRTAEGLAVFQDLVERRPLDVHAAVCYGFALQSEGRPEAKDVLNRGLQTAEAVLRDRPNDARIIGSAGIALMGIGRFAEAAQRLREASRLHPDVAVFHSNLSSALFHLGDLETAQSEARRAVELDPFDPTKHLKLSKILIRRGRHAEAEKSLRNAVHRAPRSAYIQRELGAFLMDRHRFVDAEAVYRRAVELSPTYLATYNLGNALLLQFRAAEAEQELRAAIRIDESHAEAYCNLGHALKRQGQFAAALDQFTIGDGMGRKRADWKYPSEKWISECRKSLELAKRSADILSGALRPKDYTQALEFGLFCSEIGRPDAAYRLWTEAMERYPYSAILQGRLRYQIAVAATQTALGSPKMNETPPSDDRKAELRDKALNMLRADLEAYTRMVDGAPAIRASVFSGLADWKSDSRLAPLRDPALLAVLPDSERRAWKALWELVDRTIAEVEQP